jgi:hypothetical protein
VYDEAHGAKDRKSTTNQSARDICKASANRWLVTATPMQNDYSELVELLALIGIPYDSKRTSAQDFIEANDRYLLRATHAQLGIALPPLGYVTQKVRMDDTTLAIVAKLQESDAGARKVSVMTLRMAMIASSSSASTAATGASEDAAAAAAVEEEAAEAATTGAAAAGEAASAAVAAAARAGAGAAPGAASGVVNPGGRVRLSL